MSARRVLPPDPLVPDFARARAVTLIGIGGVGGIVARHLAMFLGHGGDEHSLTLVDGDRYERANAARMYFVETGSKAESMRDELLDYVPTPRLAIRAVETYLDEDNAEDLLGDSDVVILAVDNHATRKLVSDYCRLRQDVVLISGGNDGVGPDSTGRVRRGTFGNVQVHVRRGGEDVTPSLTRHHREIREPRDRLPTDVGCDRLQASVPQIVFTNLATASAVLNAFYLHVSGALHYGELSFDIADGVMSPSPLGRLDT